MGGPMRLRDRREVHARRHSGRWRLAATGGVLALTVGAACLAPLAPAALSPHSSGGDNVSAAAPPAVPTPVPGGGPGAGAGVGAVLPRVTPVPARATATRAPTLVPTPVVVPTLTTGGVSVLDSVRSDRTAHWVRNTTETPLRSGPNIDATVFTTLPQWTLLKQ